MAAAIGLLVYGSQDDELTILWTVGGVLAAGCAYVSVCFAVSLSIDPKRGCRYVASVLWYDLDAMARATAHVRRCG